MILDQVQAVLNRLEMDYELTRNDSGWCIKINPVGCHLQKMHELCEGLLSIGSTIFAGFDLERFIFIRNTSVQF